MTQQTTVQTVQGEKPKQSDRQADPCILVIFGASGDLTKRLLMPALYNLVCEKHLTPNFAIVGTALDNLTTETFRERMSTDIKTFSTRKKFDQAAWDHLNERLYYLPGNFGEADSYRKMLELVDQLDVKYGAKGNILFYMAVPPSIFGMISTHLSNAGVQKRERGWKRVIVEKPFGHDLPSAIALNKEILSYWDESKIYRIDHYLGKETVQNILAFRFSNGIYEPLWNKNYIDHIQFNVCEMVGVEGRGKYYDTSGVLRDMIQNHMFQMLAYLCMEPPSSFKPDAVRNEKAKLLDAVRVMTQEEVLANTVRGQYGPGKKPDGSPCVGYREEPDVPDHSCTETFAAMKLLIDNWRWDGVPIYLRSGKALWKRGTEIIVQFRKAPEVIFRGTPSEHSLESNNLVFHIQPDQGIELRFHAKTPGPQLFLQRVNMRFDYREAFEASRGTGYEVMLYNCMIGDATLFSRTDLVETAWRVAQPLLDAWTGLCPTDLPNYPAGSWGPKAAYDLIEKDGRKWVEVVNREVLEKVPLFKGSDPVFLNTLAMSLKTDVYNPGDYLIRQGEMGEDMFILSRGRVEVVDANGKQMAVLSEGSFFGELSLLTSQPRAANVRALDVCDVYMLGKRDLERVLNDQPRFAEGIREVCKERYKIDIKPGG